MDSWNEWISVEDAAQRLEVPPEEIQRLVAANTLVANERSDVRLWDVEEYAELLTYDRAAPEQQRKLARAVSGLSPTRTPPNPTYPEPRSLRPRKPASPGPELPEEPVRRKLPSRGFSESFRGMVESVQRDVLRHPLPWHEYVSIDQAARTLSLCRSRISKLANDSRLSSYVDTSRRRWIIKDDLNREIIRRGCTPPQTTTRPKRPATIDHQPTTIHNQPSTSIPLPREKWVGWVGASVAAQMLQVSFSHLHKLVKQGKVPRERGPKGRWLYDTLEMERIGSERIARGAARGQPRNFLVWGSRRKSPLLAEDDFWIPVKKAAEILGVNTRRITEIVDRGYLFAHQKYPGTCGSRIYLSNNMVCRYAARPERLAARRRWENRGDRPADIDWHEAGIGPINVREHSAATRRNRGDFYSTRQTAILLHVHPSTVRKLRISGRLKGAHRPLPSGRRTIKVKPRGKGKRWWFYAKEEVEALMIDHEYLKHHRTYVKTLHDAPRRKAEKLERDAEACLEIAWKHRTRARWDDRPGAWTIDDWKEALRS